MTIDFKAIPRHIVLALLTLYKIFVSPALVALFGSACRYEESCSTYAVRVVKRDGALRGSGLAILRLLSCNPLGIDFSKATFKGCRKWTKKFLSQ